LYLILAGFPPFSGRSREEIIEKAIKGKIDLSHPQWNKISPDAKQLLLSLLTYDPSKRISAATALKNPWIQKYAKVDNVKIEELRKIIDNLKNFKPEMMLQKAILCYIASQQMTNEEEIKIRQYYSYLDQDKDGKISKQDLTAALLKIHKNNIKKAKKEAEYILKNMNFTGQIAISYNGNKTYP